MYHASTARGCHEFAVIRCYERYRFISQRCNWCSVEIGFFRQALQVKRENILSIKSKKDATDRLVEKKDVAMKELENAKSVLESSHGNIKEEMTKLETEATLMQEDLKDQHCASTISSKVPCDPDYLL